jgi:hypothetical protein
MKRFSSVLDTVERSDLIRFSPVGVQVPVQVPVPVPDQDQDQDHTDLPRWWCTWLLVTPWSRLDGD